ncbi:MAG: polyprenyl synthetase family protein [Chlamydiae bacterium]|jgi:geranylgeranyl pyrophosphate synthase|nr:polyprenyl synthetase family protein [Chlamydiota bacterium]
MQFLLEEKLENSLLKISNQRLRDASQYALFSGGKRLRPKMLLSIAGNEGLDIAAAIEMIHTYTLIHDDLPAMDNDDFRRGKPTLHKAFDESTAILVGDLLLTLAFEIVSESLLPSALIVKITNLIAKNVGANSLIEGQFLDLQSKNQTISWQDYQKIASYKTANLFTTALLSGAYIKNLSQDEIATYSQFGQTFGLLFQMKDDLKDQNSQASSEELEKGCNLLFFHAEHLLSKLSSPNRFLSDCLSSLSKMAVTEMSDQTFNAVSIISKNA